MVHHFEIIHRCRMYSITVNRGRRVTCLAAVLIILVPTDTQILSQIFISKW